MFARRLATVRNRPQPFVCGPYGRAYGEFCKKKGPFWSRGFKRCVASFRVAGMALCDIPTCFIICRKSFLCGRRNASASFSEDELQFSWQAQHIGDLHRHFAWRGATLQDCRVGCFLPIALSGLRQVVTKCKFRGRRGIM